MKTADLTLPLQQQVQQAIAAKQPLRIIGGGSKAFYSQPDSHHLPALAIAEHCGIVAYEPSELVVTVRAGMPLRELEALLAQHNQMLAFEPPHFADSATVGGMVACGFSGSRRPFAGSVRDFVLGCKLLNGQGEVLNFGGQVMKNVAGFDVSRLMVGSLGTLGALLEVSLRVLPMPNYEASYRYPLSDKNQAIALMNQWQTQPWPFSGLAFDGEAIIYRLAGAEAAVKKAAAQLGGDKWVDGADFWQALREQQLSFFQTDQPLWRLSVAPATPWLELPGEQWLDWSGALRWLVSDAPASQIQPLVQNTGGFAQCFRHGFNPLSPVNESLVVLNRRIQHAFDPLDLFNPDLKSRFNQSQSI